MIPLNGKVKVRLESSSMVQEANSQNGKCSGRTARRNLIRFESGCEFLSVQSVQPYPTFGETPGADEYA